MGERGARRGGGDTIQDKKGCEERWVLLPDDWLEGKGWWEALGCCSGASVSIGCCAWVSGGSSINVPSSSSSRM